MEDPFLNEGWSTEAVWSPPVPAPAGFHPATSGGGRLAVMSGRLPHGTRALPHAVMQLSRALLDQLRRRGYDVLLVDPFDDAPELPGPVDLLVGELRMFDAVRPHLAPGGKAVWIGTRPHWTFESTAVAARRREVEHKKGFLPCVPPWELGEWNTGSDHADAVLAYDRRTYLGRPPRVGEIGNSYLRTLAAGGPPALGRGFLWLGTGSLVRKGLDLALEVFRDERSLDLWVAAPLHWQDQRDFVWHYREELFHTPNVHAAGLVLPVGSQWRELVAHNGFALMPSCAEGVVGALLDAMVCGLVPVATSECGVDLGDFGVRITELTTAGVKAAVRAAAAIAPAELAERSAAARACALERYSSRRVAERVGEHLDGLLTAVG